MAYKHGQFVWFEIVTPDPADGAAFWSKVAGIEVTPIEMGGPKPYRMLKGAGGTVGGLVEPRMEGVPPHVTAYLSVQDVDASAARVEAHGGRVLVAPADTPLGRFAVVADPQGATFQLWKGAQGDDNNAVGVDWTELWARDAPQVLAFYRAVFGYGHEEMAMPTGAYHLLKVGETNAAGLMTSPDPQVPPMWLPYVTVEDVDAVVANAAAAGGAVHAPPMQVDGVGRFAIIADRQGVVAGVIRPESRS
jgi:uncharacterized protein